MSKYPNLIPVFVPKTYGLQINKFTPDYRSCEELRFSELTQKHHPKNCYFCAEMIHEKRKFGFLFFALLFLAGNLSFTVLEASQVSNHELKTETSVLKNASTSNDGSTITINGILHSSIHANENNSHTFYGFNKFKKVFGDFSSRNNLYFLIAASSFSSFEKVRKVSKPRFYITFLSLLI